MVKQTGAPLTSSCEDAWDESLHKKRKKKVLREPGGARLQAPSVFTLTMGHTNGCKSKWLCWSSVREPTQTNWVNQTGDSWQDRECE